MCVDGTAQATVQCALAANTAKGRKNGSRLFIIRFLPPSIPIVQNAPRTRGPRQRSPSQKLPEKCETPAFPSSEPAPPGALPAFPSSEPPTGGSPLRCTGANGNRQSRAECLSLPFDVSSARSSRFHCANSQ